MFIATSNFFALKALINPFRAPVIPPTAVPTIPPIPGKIAFPSDPNIAAEEAPSSKPPLIPATVGSFCNPNPAIVLSI